MMFIGATVRMMVTIAIGLALLVGIAMFGDWHVQSMNTDPNGLPIGMPSSMDCPHCGKEDSCLVGRDGTKYPVYRCIYCQKDVVHKP